ncbi:MAG: oligosaccharide flippase family protein [Clostridia bacterium]|nr:oligosaccharide flippase family protein [Clostridia bacterium]
MVACNLLSKFLGAVYRIPLLKVLGSEGLGLYQLIFPIYALVLVICSSGITVALSKFISKEVRYKNSHNLKTLLKASFIISASVSTILSLIFCLISRPLSVYQGEVSLFYCYLAIVPSIVLSTLISTFKGYFLGKNKMIYSGSLQIVSQIAKLFFSLLLANIFAKNGIVFAVLGAVLGITISEIITLLVATIIYFSKKSNSMVIYGKIKNTNEINVSKCASVNKLKNANGFTKIISLETDKNKLVLKTESRYLTLKNAIKKVVKFGLFVSLEACIIPLTGALDSILVVPLLIKSGLTKQLAFTLFGLEDGIVYSLVCMPTVFASSISSSLIPNIKSLSKENTSTNKNISESIKIVWLISLACALIFIFFSKDIIKFLYSNNFSDKIVDEFYVVENLLKFNAFSIIYLSLLNLSTSILQGLEQSKKPLINLGISALIRLILILILIPINGINIYGLAVADVVFYSLSFVLNLREIKKSIYIKFSVKNFILTPVVCASIMCLSMKFLNLSLGGLLPAKVLTLFMLLIGVLIYISLLLFTKVIDVQEIKNKIFRRKIIQNS